MLSKWYSKFSSQPHQPFFTSGIIFFIIFMSLLSLVYLDMIDLNATFHTYHVYSMIYIVFIQFFVGFLFVVFPRFLAVEAVTKITYMYQFYAYFLCSIAILLSIIYYPKVAIVFQLLMFVTQVSTFKTLLHLHAKSEIKIKEDTKWILVSFFFGLVANFLFMLSTFEFKYVHYFEKVATNIGFYLFLFMTVFTISQRMIPFFTTAKYELYKINKSKYLLNYVHFFLVLKVFLLLFDNYKLNLISDIPLFYLITKELIKWKLPLFKVPAIMWILYLAMYWIPIGFLLSIIESISSFIYPNIIYEKIVIHTFALGYFVTALIGFGTRVILGHSGQVPHAGKLAIGIFISIQFVTIIRLLASLSVNLNSGYMFLLTLSSIILVIGLLLWSSKYLIILIKGK